MSAIDHVDTADDTRIEAAIRRERAMHSSSRSQAQSTLKRLLAVSAFWMLCLTLTAAGHRLYKATVAVDRSVSAGVYQTQGMPVVWVGHGTVDAARQRIDQKPSSRAASQVHVLPNSSFWLGAAAAFTLLAALMAWSGRWIANPGLQSLVGLFAGHFLWLGAIEFGLDAAGRRLGLAGSLDVVGGQIVGTHSGGILIQLSGVFLVPMLIGLTLHESNRCVLFQWFRRRLPIVRTPAASGRVENYAARTTIQYFMTVWFCYVGVLWLADSRLGRFGEISLLATMLAIFGATPYMMWRATKQSSRAQALRYSISGAVVTWTGIEIAAAMRFFEEPWLSHSTASGVVLLGLTILLTGWTAHSLGSSESRATGLHSPVAVMILAGFTTVGITGCGPSDVSASMTAEQVKQQIDSYQQRIPQPTSDVREGLLHALSSPDPEVRAQAAIAFGKSKFMNPAVREQLEILAANDDSRLSQFAALTALTWHDALPPPLHTLLEDLRGDPEWGPIVSEIHDRKP